MNSGAISTNGHRIRAFAKINLTLRVLGVRPDGYHELRTVFQSLSLHDTLVVERAPGPFRIVCSDPNCPSDERNLVWRAADRLARHARRRNALRDLRIRITKRIPLEAGLGGGSSDAAATLRLLARLWKLTLAPSALAGIAASLGADVPYFLHGGTMLGVGRGDRLFALADPPPMWVVTIAPPFGVSSKEAYGWWDQSAGADPGVRSGGGRGRAPAGRRGADTWVGPCIPADEWRNDLEPPVVARRPEIGRLVRRLRTGGADYAAMSGSGSAVFGLFRTRTAAAAVVARSARPGHRVVLTRTVGHGEYGVLANLR